MAERERERESSGTTITKSPIAGQQQTNMVDQWLVWPDMEANMVDQ